VVWPDVAFGAWAGEDLSRIPNLVSLNWALVLARGAVGDKGMVA
jgi:hypothetical protein